MQEQAVVEVSLQLPRPIAAEVEELKQRRPDLLARMVQYGLTRQLVLDHLESLQTEQAGELAAAPNEA